MWFLCRGMTLYNDTQQNIIRYQSCFFVLYAYLSSHQTTSQNDSWQIHSIRTTVFPIVAMRVCFKSTKNISRETPGKNLDSKRSLNPSCLKNMFAKQMSFKKSHRALWPNSTRWIFFTSVDMRVDQWRTAREMSREWMNGIGCAFECSVFMSST